MYGVPGMAEKLHRAEQEKGMPFSSLENIPDVEGWKAGIGAVDGLSANSLKINTA